MHGLLIVISCVICILNVNGIHSYAFGMNEYMSNCTGTCLVSHLPSILLHTNCCRSISVNIFCIAPDLHSCTLWRIHKGYQGYTPLLGPISFIFMQFSAKTMQNNRLIHQTLELASLFWKILDPPQF